MRLKDVEKVEQNDAGIHPRSSGAIVGAVGAVIVALGACALAYESAAEQADALTKLGIVALALGGIVVGIAWVLALKDGHGGFGAIGGSFALPAAIAYVYFESADLGGPELEGALVLGALTWYALGIALGRGLRFTRVVAGAVAAVLAITLVGALAHWSMSASSASMLAALCFAGIAAVSVGLVIEMPGLRSRPF